MVSVSVVSYVSMTFFFLISTVSASISFNPPINCPKELFRQKIVCEPGQALSSVTWIENIPNCRQYQATCLNATSSCSEHCEWNPMCQANASVGIEMEYVRGIEIVYEYIDEKQTASFLCCHSEDLKTAILDCDGKSSTELDGKSQPKLFSIMSQAMSKDFALSLRGDLPTKVTYCPVLNIPTCPADKIQTNLKGSDFPAPGAGGVAAGGGGGGYVGLSLVGCSGESGMLTGVNMMGCRRRGSTPTPEACVDLCRVTPGCVGMTYNPSNNRCYWCPPNTPIVRSPSFTTFILCVTPAQQATINSLGLG